MKKLNSLTSRITKEVTLTSSIIICIIIGFLEVLSLVMLAKYNYYALLFIIIPLFLLWIYSVIIALHKSADNMYMRMQNSALEVIEKGLSFSFTRVKFIGDFNNNMVRKILSNLEFWAKLDRDGNVILIVTDVKGAVIYEEITQNYLWVIKNFYVYKFFTNSLD